MLTGAYSMPRGVPFLAALAECLIQQSGNDPLALAHYRVLLPNRRSVRALRDIFLRITDGRATLLPRLISIGDVDNDADLSLAGLLADDTDLPPPLTDMERLVQLSQFVRKKDETLSAAQALALAQDLGALLNEFAQYEVDRHELAQLAQEAYPEHWQHTLKFLNIITDVWPDYLATIGRSDPAMYRIACLRKLAAAWRSEPPRYPVVVAGMARAEKHIVALLDTVLHNKGAVVFPALDLGLHETEWLALDAVHPDVLLREMMVEMGLTRNDLQLWPLQAVDAPQARLEWLSLAMQPSDMTASWQATALKRITPAALDNIDLLECADEATEAQTIALIIRKELEHKQQTVSLVTPDRALARRVAVLLKRWGIEADDSSGKPLMRSMLGIYLQLVAAAARPDAQFGNILALLKHPLCGLDLTADVKGKITARLETDFLRGHYMAAGLAPLVQSVQQNPKADEELSQMLQRLLDCMLPFQLILQNEHVVMQDCLQAHLQAAEQLAATDAESGEQRLWIGEEAEAASNCLAELMVAAKNITLEAADYDNWLAQILGRVAVRVPYGLHPRVTIQGLIESRLHGSDVMILAGLNEGIWPSLPAISPWLNRDMRRRLGLPDIESYIAQQAHDFTSAAAAPRVYLTRALRQDGTATVPARWLMRMQAVLKPTKLLDAWQAQGGAFTKLAQAIDKGAGNFTASRQPSVNPKPALRPRSAYVTDIERLMQDPYSYYARNILGLRTLDPLDNMPTVAEKGRFMHAVLSRFLSEISNRRIAPMDMKLLRDIGNELLQPFASVPGITELWGTWLEEAGRWFLQEEGNLRAVRMPVALEEKGSRRFDDMDFELKAKADRIDVQPGETVVVDYKTGVAPSVKQVGQGYWPQLPLEILIANANGFNERTESSTYKAEYWKLASTYAGCERRDVNIDIENTIEGFRALVTAYFINGEPFTALPVPAAIHNDYRHLARTQEWAFAQDEGEAA